MPRQCRECQQSLASVRSVAVFCSVACRKAFNNRRAMRGAVLYDLWMAHRYQRGMAKEVGAFAAMCVLGQQYRKADAELRGHSWNSWEPPDEVIAARPRLRSTASRIT